MCPKTAVAETIAAPITAPGPAAVCVVRVSGPLTRGVLEKLVLKADKIIAQPRKLVAADVLDCSPVRSEDQAPALDYALVAFFPAPHSYTGEDCAEFGLHGSPFIVAHFLELLGRWGVRAARPGEFTQRAFLNGRMDLSQAEAVADLISAETQLQVREARRQLEGRLAHAVSDLGEPLRNVLVEIEVCLDFPEEDAGIRPGKGWVEALGGVKNHLSDYLESFGIGRLYREGANVVLAGIRNAGKSSLLNALVGEEQAIVTPVPGTTRDSIEGRISVDGLFVRLWDTAGLVDEGTGVDQVEKIGIERSWEKISMADLVVFIIDLAADIPRQEQLYGRIAQKQRPVLAVLNKTDLCPAEVLREVSGRFKAITGTEAAPISALRKEGLSGLRAAMREKLIGRDTAAASVLITNRRHYEALAQAGRALERAADALEKHLPLELAAIEIRAALGALSDIIGVTTTEDILGRIFSRFCIGK
jgi:tRNA modification GTPase